MLAIKAFYDNGNIQWLGKPPVKRAEIIVVFSTVNEQSKTSRSEMSTEEALRILDKYTGCIQNPDFDYEKEKDKYFNEKFGSLN